MGSYLIRFALQCAVPAGKALAVDRELFSKVVTQAICNNPNITVIEDEVCEIPEPPVIIATGPLTSDNMAQAIQQLLGENFMAFYDAAAPIVETSTIDMNKVFAQSRYGKGGDDYLNSAMDKQQYEEFIDALLQAQKVIPREFESKDLFSACQPVEEIARSGRDALRYGPLKPVGITDPRTQSRPWAVIQLRAENANLTAYNLVGFQTNLKHSEQQRVFRMIPGLENAEFLRYGVMHRNTFVDAPNVLSTTLEVLNASGVRMAGQLTGTEGYCEAIASGLYAALATYAQLQNTHMPLMPKQTMFGSLLSYATNPETKHYQPMHVNYGIAMPFEKKIKRKQERYEAYAQRARNAIDEYRQQLCSLELIPQNINTDIPHELLRYINEHKQTEVQEQKKQEQKEQEQSKQLQEHALGESNE